MIIEREAAENIAPTIQRGALKMFSVRSLLPLTHGVGWNDVEYLDAMSMRDELQQSAREHLRVEIRLPKRGTESKLSAVHEGQEAAADDQSEARCAAADWRELARVEATLIIERDRKSDLYPFGLAYLEALLRAVDQRASRALLGDPLLEGENGHHALETSESELAPPEPGGASLPPLAAASPQRGAKHGLRRGTGEPGDAGSGTRPPASATRYVEGSRGILSYTEVAPLIAQRVAAVGRNGEALSGLAADKGKGKAVIQRAMLQACAEVPFFRSAIVDLGDQFANPSLLAYAPRTVKETVHPTGFHLEHNRHS